MDAWPVEPMTTSQWNAESGPRTAGRKTGADHASRLAEAERDVLSTALLWLNDQTVASDVLADVIQAYADLLDSQERNL